MKPLFIFLIASFCCTSLINGQYYDDVYQSSKNSIPDTFPKPDKGTNTIIILTNNNAEDNFTSFGKYLITKGYTFEVKDKDFLSLVTYQKPPSGFDFHYKLFISFNSKSIIVKSRHHIGNMTLEPQYRGELVEWKYTKNQLEIANIVYRQMMSDFSGFEKTGYEFRKE